MFFPPMSSLLDNPAFRTVITGAGFFADSYDLFITDGVTSMLKSMGPTTKVIYTYYESNAPVTVTSFFSARCVSDLLCLPNQYNNVTHAWEPNAASVWDSEMTPRYSLQTPDMKNAVSNAALIGSILGQLFFGLAGDVLGRRGCFLLTTCLIIIGCIGSATAAAGTAGSVKGIFNNAGAWASVVPIPTTIANDVYLQLAIWRGILGFGIGGEYPLASTISSEGAKKGASRGQAVLFTFSQQGWGKLTASLMNFGLVSALRHFGGSWTLDAAWRMALAFGCLPNLITLPFRFLMEESEIYKTAKINAEAVVDDEGEIKVMDGYYGMKTNALAMLSRARATLLRLSSHWRTLAGTCSTWFLIDVTFYGQSLLNTTVVSEAVASTAGLNSMERLRSSLLSTVWIMLIAIPGYFVAIALVDRGRKPLQVWGFAACAALFAVLGFAYDTPLRTGGGGGGFVFLYGLTYLASNAGPNSITFLMPTEAFPTLSRSLAHGISAASGKIGATVGSFGLLHLLSSFCVSQKDATTGLPNCFATNSPTAIQSREIAAGVRAVMLLCAGVATLGCFATIVLCKETKDAELGQLDTAEKVVAVMNVTDDGIVPIVLKKHNENSALLNSVTK
jgi:PHS family inorganic phosphate transporter-like MFS transporter